MIFGHFLQSPKWEDYEHLEGHETRRIKGEGFEALAVLHKTPLGNYLFVPYGPVIEVDSVEDLDRLFGDSLVALRNLAKEHKAFFVRIEPTFAVEGEGVVRDDEYVVPIDKMREYGLVKSHDLEPAHTWVLDLNVPREEILAGVEKNRVRAWRNYEKHGIRIEKTTDPKQIEILTNLLDKLGAARGFAPQNYDHLRHQMEAGFAILYVAYKDDRPIAASLVHDDGETRFAMHAASDDDYKKERAGALLTLQAIVDAQEAGMEVFDFWGMTPSQDPKHPWYGFTQHKMSFGGRQVDYAGTWDLPISKFKYKVYTAIRKINRVIRKKSV